MQKPKSQFQRQVKTRHDRNIFFFNHANGNQLWYVQSNREWRPNKMDPDKQARIDKKVAIMAQRLCQSPGAVGIPENLRI